MKSSAACLIVAGLGFSLPAGAQEGAAKPNPPVLKQTTTEFPKADKLEARIMTADLAPGMTSPWHTHASPVAVYVLEGTFTLEMKGREPIVLKAGQGMLEPIDVEMRATNRHDQLLKVVIFQVSDPAQPFMHPTSTQ